MKENGKMVKEKEKVFIIGMMVIYIKVVGRMIKEMEKE